MTSSIKARVLNEIADGRPTAGGGRALYRVGNRRIHVRFCSTDRRRVSKYKFNISPTTLSADYELWICGDADSYYLILSQVVHEIYGHPKAYVDSRHPQLRVVSVDAAAHNAMFARGGVSMDVRSFFRARLYG
jgi:hypothetical protein